MEGINIRVLLFSTGNYIQYPVINHKEKNMKKYMYVYVCMHILYVYVYIYVYLNHFAV